MRESGKLKIPDLSQQPSYHFTEQDPEFDMYEYEDLICKSLNFTPVSINCMELGASLQLQDLEFKVGTLDLDLALMTIGTSIGDLLGAELIYSLVLDMKYDNTGVSEVVYLIAIERPVRSIKIVAYRPPEDLEILDCKVLIPGKELMSNEEEIVNQLLRRSNPDFKGLVVIGESQSYVVKFIDLPPFQSRHISSGSIIAATRLYLTAEEFYRIEGGVV